VGVLGEIKKKPPRTNWAYEPAFTDRREKKSCARDDGSAISLPLTFANRLRRYALQESSSRIFQAAICTASARVTGTTERRRWSKVFR